MIKIFVVLLFAKVTSMKYVRRIKPKVWFHVSLEGTSRKHMASLKQ